MKKEMMDLLDEINTKKASVSALYADGKDDEANAVMDEVEKLQKKFDNLSKIEDVAPVAPQIATPKAGKSEMEKFVDMIRNRSFANTASEGGGSPAGTLGGFTVPADIDTKVNQYKQDLVSLEPLISVETVKAPTGARTFQKKGAPSAFATVAEAAAIQAGTDMQFERVTYACEKRAAYWGVTEELLEDSDADIAGLLAQWIARGDVVTTNTKVLALLAALTATSITGATEVAKLDAIKAVINKSLGSVYKQNATFVTNDTGLNWLDTLKDADNRYLLTPDISNPGKLRLSAGAISIPVFVVPDAQLPNDTTSGTVVPAYVGDFKEFAKKFQLRQRTIKNSDAATVNSVSAFENDLVYYKVTERNDFKAVDTDAVKALAITM